MGACLPYTLYRRETQFHLKLDFYKKKIAVQTPFSLHTQITITQRSRYQKAIIAKGGRTPEDKAQ